MSDLTPSQTVGPFLHLVLPWPDGPDAVPAGTPGAVVIRGRVLDGAGAPVPDALVETWQVGPAGFGRCPTDADGGWWIRTVKPAAGEEAPHLDVSVFARGLLDRVVTRIYFADEAAANDTDPVLVSLPDPGRRATLLAEPADDGYRFDIHLQGAAETVFFDV
jgi:protocatechuate 3,4-dioxygenase alpha subunit